MAVPAEFTAYVEAVNAAFAAVAADEAAEAEFCIVPRQVASDVAAAAIAAAEALEADAETAVDV